MDHITYHGTSQEIAKSMLQPLPNIRVDKGGGELGLGFYTGSSNGLAASWARLRYEEDGVVIKIIMNEGEFIKLQSINILNYEEVNDIWGVLRSTGLRKSFHFMTDYIIAPFATIREIGKQFKFESKKAEEVLNNAEHKIYPCS